MKGRLGIVAGHGFCRNGQAYRLSQHLGFEKDPWRRFTFGEE